jgi:sulfoxide reductase heme-binding subunit YedZ
VRRLLHGSTRTAAVASIVALCTAAGFFFGDRVEPLSQSRMFPWIVARATGIGAFVVMGALTFLGLVLRKPTRRRRRIHPETVLRMHASLGPALVVLLVAHVGSLLADRYAGVPWRSLVVPNGATYRPGAVTYGVAAAYLAMIVVVTSALAGRCVVGAHWAFLHKLTYPSFVLVWVHGVLAGSDTARLRVLYVGVGVVVLLAAVPAVIRNSSLVRPGATP